MGFVTRQPNPGKQFMLQKLINKNLRLPQYKGSCIIHTKLRKQNIFIQKSSYYSNKSNSAKKRFQINMKKLESKSTT